MSGEHFGTSVCRMCGRSISLNGLAQYQHQQKHYREGLTWDTPEGQAAMKHVKAEREAQAQTERQP